VRAHLDIGVAGYRIDAAIGQGGMGTVYRATQLRLGREVALKVMAPELADDAVFRERFLRESQIAASLDHPHIVPIFDAGEVDGFLYIAMRYVAGTDLRALVARGHGTSPAVALAVLEQLAGALDAAHARGLVHRDVKPSNVLIAVSRPDDPLETYLTDFGISKRLSDSATVERPLGSVHYMSPEQIRGERIDARSDVYSLGCLLYECVTGEAPFIRDSDVAVMYAHLQAACPSASQHARNVPPALDEVIARALAKEAVDRPASAGELAAAAARALDDSSSPDPEARRARAVRLPPLASDVVHPEERRIVGRLAEEEDLLEALEQARRGHGGVLLLVGEPGTGKTTLARWLSTQAERRGVSAVWGVGGAFGETPPPYWHWIQVLRSLARRPDGAALFDRLGAARAWLDEIAPDLAVRQPAGKGAPTRGEEGRFQTYDAISQLLHHAAGKAGLVVVLDDLHLADEASLQALGFISTVLQETRLLVVGTYREEAAAYLDPQAISDRSSPFSELVRSRTTLTLASLNAEQVQELVATRTGGAAALDLGERLHEVTAGNPLFVSELLNLLEAQGRLGESDLDSRDLPMPTGIADAIAQRLAPLSARGREALSVAAVIGTTFRAATLALAASLPPAEILELLDEAARLRLVQPVQEPPDGYAFSHGLVRASLYDALPRAKRCALHTAVGEALEQQHDLDAGEGLAEIAYHFLEAAPAGDGERAVRFAGRAAERAVRTFAYDQAVTMYKRALEIARPNAAPERIALLQALGEAQMRAGDVEAARDSLQRAADAARAHGDPEALARAALACNIWGLSSGVDEQLVGLAEEAVEGLEEGDSPGLLACSKGLLASALYWSDQVSRRERLATNALELARADQVRAPGRDSDRVLAYVIGRCLLTRWGPDSASADFALSDELVRLSQQLQDSELEILVRNWRITVLLEMGKFTAVDHEIARVEQMANELRQPRAMVFLHLHHATRELMAGRFAAAERLNAESMQTGRRVRGTVGELAAGAQLVSIRLLQGRLSEMEAGVRIVANLHPGMVGFQCLLALILVASGRPAEARAELERLMSSGVAGLPRDNSHVLMLALLADAAARLEDGGRARELLAWLEPYSGRWVVSPGSAALWPVDRSLGQLAIAAGLADVAQRYLQRARDQACRAGAAPAIALIALEEARVAAASSLADGGQQRVRTLAREARELGQQLDMGLVVDAATLLEANAG
jgi:tetratricopeptide (TPR) repeat protein